MSQPTSLMELARSVRIGAALLCYVSAPAPRMSPFLGILDLASQQHRGDDAVRVLEL